MPPVPIAGPRRPRSTAAPPQPSSIAARTTATTATSASPGATSTAGAAGRSLVPLDYDEMRSGASRAPAAPAKVSGTPAAARRSRRVGWFVLGVAFGAVGAVWATGETGHTLKTARAWGGSALRSLERKPAVTAPARPQSMNVTVAPDLTTSKPCPVDPSEDDPCAELLAPFGGPSGGEAAAVSVPTVPVEDLPRVKPPVAVNPRAHAAPASQSAAPTTTGEQPRQEPPRGINPNVEDSQAGPAKMAPVRVTPGPDVDPAGTAIAPT